MVDYTQIIKLSKEGLCGADIARVLGLHSNTVYRVLHKHNIDTSRVKVISIEDQKEIVKLYEAGHSSYYIANIYNVAGVTVRRLLYKCGVELRDNSTCNMKYTLNKHVFDCIDTEEKSYFLGLLYADGCNYLIKNTIRLSLMEEDVEILYKLLDVINSNKPLRYYPPHTGCIRGRTVNSKGGYALVIENAHVANRLNELGCVPNKTTNLVFPSFLSMELLPHFVRGYVDGDGCISNYRKGNNVCWSVKLTSSGMFCQECQNIFKKVVMVNSSLVHDKRHHHKIYNLSVGGNNQIARLLEWLYGGASIYLDRKYAKYQEFMEYYKEGVK